jgi:nucleotide-binding universal stress UspA family protein
MAHTPQEFERKLQKFAEEQGSGNGIETRAKMVIAHDPTVDLVDVLTDAIDSTGADLVVMASHQPGMAEHVFASHAGWVASHSHTSVMVVR